MASKAELVKQAQALGVIIDDDDTAKTLTQKIIQAQNAIAEKSDTAKREPVLPEEAQRLVSGLKRVKVTPEQLAELQRDGKLVGYDPGKQEAIIK
uniref:Uncharacterized protein n=1 Tax=viral metagenome TaxID=1070528 RepID=A0A6H1ZNU2_9ZZZZ